MRIERHSAAGTLRPTAGPSGCGFAAAGARTSKAAWAVKLLFVLGLSLNQARAPGALLGTLGLTRVGGTAVDSAAGELPLTLVGSRARRPLPAQAGAPLVAFLKFHKVAGATVATVFRNACPALLPPHYWNAARCPAQPHGHASLVRRARGKRALIFLTF